MKVNIVKTERPKREDITAMKSSDSSGQSANSKNFWPVTKVKKAKE